MTTILKRYSFRVVVASVLAAASLAGCDSVQNNPKTAGGGLLGGIGGGVIGSQIGGGTGKTAAIIGGTLLGALAGSEVGKSLDRADKMYAERTTHNALETSPSGGSVAWSNPDTGHSGTVMPTSTYYRGDQPCREFTSTITVAGRSEPAKGTACREADGTWRIVQQ